MKKSHASRGPSASELISKRIAELADWRGKTLGRMRRLIKEADPDVVEELKWVKPTNSGTPTWSHEGIICTGETYKSVVKLTFARGASLKDPSGLFNSSLDGNVRRAIDIHEGVDVETRPPMAQFLRRGNWLISKVDTACLFSALKRASSAPGRRRTRPQGGTGQCMQATDPSRRVVVIPGTRALSPTPYADRLSRPNV